MAKMNSTANLPQATGRKIEAQGRSTVTEAYMVALVNEQFTGRKFELDDVSPHYHQFAEWWIANYQITPGTFEFIRSLREDWDARQHLTIGQAKGALNCFRADVLRAAKTVAQATSTTPQVEITEGFWVIEGEQPRIFKIQVAHHGSGNLYGKELDLETGEFNYFKSAVYFLRRNGATKLTLEKAKELGHLYGRCMKCGATLTDERSIEAGIGPVCASKGW